MPDNNITNDVEKQGIIVPNSYGPYNKVGEKEQWIRISEGCPHQCSCCYEPRIEKWFPFPEIERNHVKIMDMRLVGKLGDLGVIRRLGDARVNGKVVYYELMCGIDHRVLDLERAVALKQSRFKNPRIAWDYAYEDQFKIKKAITLLKRVGYKAKDIMIFMLCNENTPLDVCKDKLNLCKYWGVQVADCWFDGQTFPNVEPIGWTKEEIEEFRPLVRKHNQFVNFGVDPELKRGA